MSWLRLDDGFTRHPKVVALSLRERWTWLEVLSYCAQYKTEGRIPRTVREVVPKATAAYLDRCAELGLVDVEKDLLRVHDWEQYNPRDPTAAERSKRYRDRNADRDEPRDVDRDGPVTDAVTNAVTETVPRARAAARGPSPTPTPEEQQQEQTPTTGTITTPRENGGGFDLERLQPLTELDQLRAETEAHQ